MVTVDPKEWLNSRGIAYKDAQKLAQLIKQHYPDLIKALKSNCDVRGELELVELVHHVKSGRFPPDNSVSA